MSDAGLGLEWHRGWPHGHPRGRGLTGKAQVIITAEIQAFLAANPRNIFKRLAEFPVCKTTLQRLRRELGIDRESATRDWWESRIGDLIAMANVDFAARHTVSTDSVAIWRGKLGLPRLEHEDGWYLQPEALAMITSESLPLLVVARHFKRSVKTIWQLRYELRKRGICVADRRGVKTK